LPEELLVVEDLKTWFPMKAGLLQKTVGHVKAVDGVSLKIRKGETYGLVGESGSGKTTLGKSVLRLIQPTAGNVFFDSIDVTKADKKHLRKLRSRMQIIFQDPYASLSPRMRIGDAVGHPVQINGIAKGKEREKMVLEVLEKVGLTPAKEFVNLFPHQLSGGQRQRVALARSIILKPEFMVADEPVSMIDVSLRTTIIDLILGFRKELGLTHLFVTHDLAVAKYISDRIAIMYLGKIIELGSKESIFLDPLHPYTRALLSAIPVPDPERKRENIELQGEVPSAIRVPPGCRFNPRCPMKQNECDKKEPELIEVQKDHFVACPFY